MLALDLKRNLSEEIKMFDDEEQLDWCTEFSKEELDKIRNTKKGKFTVGRLSELYDVLTPIRIHKRNGILIYDGNINFMPTKFYKLKVVSSIDYISYLKVIVK